MRYIISPLLACGEGDGGGVLVSYSTENRHNIISITEESPAIKDNQVLELALIEQRIILTFDRDYGELIYRLKKLCPMVLSIFATYH